MKLADVVSMVYLGTGLQFSQNLLPASSNIFMNEMRWVEQVHL